MRHVLFVNGEVLFVSGRADRVYPGVLVPGEESEAHAPDRPIEIANLSLQE